MLPVLLIFLPFAAGIMDYLIARKSERGRDLFAAAFTWVMLLLSVFLVVLTVKEGGAAGTLFSAGKGAAGSGAGRSVSLLRMEIPYVFTGGLSIQADGFRAAYSLVTSVMWAFTTTFSLEYFRHEREHLSRYYLFVLFTLGATQGVMLSGDLLTTFLFFEILSLTSFTWVMHEETPGALRAGYTYLFIAVIGGLVLFMGLVLLQHAAGTLAYSALHAAVSNASGHSGMILAAGVCILTGFGCKAGMFPVHVWLPKAHPVAPSPASALLSGVLTKVGIYGILLTGIEALIDFPDFGWIVLILGTITMFLGAVLALFSVNLKRTLACSSMSQIGFILTGIGMTVLLHVQHGTAKAVAAGAVNGGGFAALEGHALAAMCGTLLHMVNHSMLKLCLFCAAGVVVMNLHALDLNQIRGWGRKKWLLKVSFFLGVVGIAGVPLFNGYASKTLLHEAITAGIMEAGEGAAIRSSAAGLLSVIEWIFLISGGCTFAYMLKLFLCLFVEKNQDPRRQQEYDKCAKGYMGIGSVIAVFGTSILFILLGQKPVFDAAASFMTGHAQALAHFAPLSFECVKGALISLGIGALLYLFVIRGFLMEGGTLTGRCTLREGIYVNRWPQRLDLEDLLYRPMLTRWLPGFFGAVCSVFAENKVLSVLCKGVLTCAAWMCRFLSVGPDALIVLVRKTVLKEHVVADTPDQVGFLEKRRDEVREAYRPIHGNFSFALMLSCIGMMVILGVIMFFNLRG
ncbi:MAG TPA: sodium:proton antiporter [Lachnospiraceae bacterium]|nr:sodium:proton antiporter [Lachnospiraceae bacterium]